MNNFSPDPEKVIKNKIENFVKNSPENKLIHLDGRQIFDKPLIGLARGDDSLFTRYKEIIGDFHLTPAEWLKKKAQNAPDPSTISVICWILPISEKTRKENRKENKLPAKSWAHTRNCGEIFNNSIRRYVVNLMEENGYLAIAPMLSEDFSWIESSEGDIASPWSERHAMYAAGLGTFGLCDGLITSTGKAMRCGSVITDLSLVPSTREYENHNEYCLYLSKGKCGKCIARCPGNAITKKGHNKDKCLQYQRENINPSSFGVDIAGCGLCQTDVPCEKGIPGD